MLSKREEELTDQLIALAREKGYREDTIEILLMLSCTANMRDHFGTSEQATEKICDLAGIEYE